MMTGLTFVIEPWHLTLLNSRCWGNFRAQQQYIRLGAALCVSRTAQVLKLRTIGLSDYSVLEGRQRIGRIRLATERMPCVWLWNVSVHLPGGLPMGSAKDLSTAKSEFREAWKALKARTPPEQLAAAYRAMNIRGDG
jgi:hypothetical protein